MRSAKQWYGAFVAALCVGQLLCGCVERTMKITTQPPGARVFVNDEEIGVSPVRTSFLWYGDYDILIRKQGFDTLKTSHRVQPPWYQIPPFDFVAETLVPGTLHDDHVLPTYTLTPTSQPSASDLVGRATELRDRTRFGGND